MPVADKRYYVSNDRTRVVEEDDVEAGSLLAAEGGEISDEDVKKYGIKFGTKAEKPAANKAEQPSEDKSEVESESPRRGR